MSSAPALLRIAETVKQLGEVHLDLAEQIEAAAIALGVTPELGPPSPSTRSSLLELVRSVLTELGLLPSEPDLSGDPDPSDESGLPDESGFPDEPGLPGAPLSDPQPDEESMSILFRDFAYAHARLAMRDDEIVVERGIGFERVAYPATRPPEVVCHPDEIPPLSSARPEPAALPRNTRLVRLRLTADHQIDPNEVVAIAVPADRDTAYRYEVKAIAVNDRTIDVAVRTVDPDIHSPGTIARVHVLLLRVA